MRFVGAHLCVIDSNIFPVAVPYDLDTPSGLVRTGLKPRCYDWKADRATVGGGVGSDPQPPKGALYP